MTVLKPFIQVGNITLTNLTPITEYHTRIDVQGSTHIRYFEVKLDWYEAERFLKIWVCESDSNHDNQRMILILDKRLEDTVGPTIIKPTKRVITRYLDEYEYDANLLPCDLTSILASAERT